MKKKNILWIILGLIFLVVFNAVFFILCGTEHNTSVWISYAFIHFSYLMMIATPFLTRKSNSAAVFGFSLYSVSSAYFMITFIIGIILIIIHPEDFKIPLIIHIILSGLYGIMLITNMIANESTADSLERHEEELKYVKNCSEKLKAIMDDTNDKKILKRIEKLYDLIHSSPVRSDYSARRYELEVIDLINNLQTAVNYNDKTWIEITDKIEKIANERNRILKYNL